MREQAARQQAAVDAAVTQAIRDESSTSTNVSTPSSAAPSSPAKRLLTAVKERNAARQKASAVLQRIKASGGKKPAAKKPAAAAKPAAAKRPAPASSSPAPAPSKAKASAIALRNFLAQTHRFGTKNDRPAEVSAAQRAMGLKPDGIVGPSTRARAKTLGVTLPLR